MPEEHISAACVAHMLLEDE